MPGFLRDNREKPASLYLKENVECPQAMPCLQSATGSVFEHVFDMKFHADSHLLSNKPCPERQC